MLKAHLAQLKRKSVTSKLWSVKKDNQNDSSIKWMLMFISTSIQRQNYIQGALIQTLDYA